MTQVSNSLEQGTSKMIDMSVEPKTLAELREDVEAGKALWMQDDNVDNHFVFKKSDDTYCYVKEGQDGRKAISVTPYEALPKAISDLGSIASAVIAVSPVWVVISGDIRRCDECEIPVDDISLEVGLCYACYGRMREEQRENGRSHLSILSNNRTQTESVNSKLLKGMHYSRLLEMRQAIATQASTAEKAREFVKMLASTDWDTFYREKACFEYIDLEDHPF